ncbi:MAG: nucleotidyltransferase family protein [Bacteriovoracaceae bacterium]|nr:nucleotidyltransferase family protein [Bacteriovoracaceae bacterium]
MTKINKYVVNEKSSIFNAIKFITEQGTQFAIIVDDSMKLKGVITDGDIRIGILRSLDLQSSVTNIMNKNPKILQVGYEHGQLIKLLNKFKIKQLPIVDKDMKVVDVYLNNKETFIENERRNPVVLMAGGLGSRLGELTSNCPKPLLKVGNKPILEIILENFIEYGFKNFYFSVNYMSDQIEQYFKDGSDWGVSISYIKETVKLGTAGGLGLADFDRDEPIIIMNGDLLTKVNFSQLLDFHEKSKSDGTMCVRKYDFQVPYGVIETDGDSIQKIIEKPIHAFFVNAGIYVLNPKFLDYIKQGEYMDMPTLFDLAKTKMKNLKVFPIHEYWLDIGRLEDFEKAQVDFKVFFNN